MRRLALAGLALLLATPAWAQWPSTRAQEVLESMFTQGGNFGFPPYAADPFTCNAQTERATYYNTTSDSVLFCNGTAWAGLGGGGAASQLLTAATDPVACNAANRGAIFYDTDNHVVKYCREASLTFQSVLFGTTGSSNNQVMSRMFSAVGAGIYFGADSEAGAFGVIVARSEQTPDSMIVGVGALSRTLIIGEAGDENSDYAIAQQTNPTLAIASASGGSAEQRMFLAHNQTQGLVTDGANTAANRRPIGFTGGSAVASGATITPTGNVFHVTGTTGISAMTIMAAGTCVTLIFDGAVIITDGAGFNIGAAYTTSADDTLTMCSDGTNWREAGRSVN